MKKVIEKFFIPKNILLIILFGGFFLRVFHPLTYFQYGHDQDLLSWFIKDVVVNNHLRLIGQQTSSVGIFIGPLFYYLQIPFYLFTRMDPAGGLILVTILGMFTIFSFYWVLNKIFGKKVGLVGGGIYAFCYLIVFADREVVPTMPVMLWTVWYFYAVWLIMKGKDKAYLLIGFLWGLVWELNLALALLVPLVPLAQIFSKKKPALKSIILGLIIFFVTLSPFLLFESRHGFSQTKSIVSSLTTNKDYSGGSSPGFAKLDRVMQLTYANTTRLFWGFHYPGGIVKFTFYALAAVFVFLIYKKRLPGQLGTIMFFWQVLYITFFTLNPINVSEYYLNGMNVIWVAIIAVGVVYLLEQKPLLRYGVFVIVIFLYGNLYSFATHNTSRNGYIEKKELIKFVIKDSREHDYPCVAISYITAPGYQFGYRYLFYMAGLKVKDPISKAPVYSIVFPQSIVDRIDLGFGALGLTLPDYKRYTNEGVNRNCEGEDSNLTNSMFGYTQ